MTSPEALGFAAVREQRQRAGVCLDKGIDKLLSAFDTQWNLPPLPPGKRQMLRKDSIGWKR
jgi:hypothetical protein